MTIQDITKLLVSLKSDIGDDYRASDDPDDSTPGMCVTIASNDGKDWTYQTGDNSYTGGCYHYRHWGVIYLYRRSNCRALAKDAISEVLDGIMSERDNAKYATQSTSEE